MVSTGGWSGGLCYTFVPQLFHNLGLTWGDCYTFVPHMGYKPKVHRGYRLKAETVELIEKLAEQQGLKSQAEVIDGWAEAWMFENGVPAGMGSEKKSGGRGESIMDNVPDELIGGKRRPVTELGQELRKRVPGLKAAAELKEPAKKKEVHEMNTQGQIERKPITRPNGKI